jgi:hypothetical protein
VFGCIRLRIPVIRLFKVSVPSSIVLLIVSEAILLLSCYVIAVYWTVEAADVFLFDDDGIWGVSFVVLVVLIGLYFADMYND